MRAVLQLAVLSVLMFFPRWAAGDISVVLTADRQEATLADTVQLSVTVQGVRSADEEPVIQGLDDFFVSRSGTSSRVQIINSRVESSVEYGFTVQPKKTGAFFVGPATVSIDGQTYASDTVVLNVTEGRHGAVGTEGPLFLTAALSSVQAYVEQQVVYTLKLFRQTRVTDLSLQLPELEHMVFKKLGEPKEYQSVIDQQTYQVLEVQYVLSPTRPGKYGIQPARMNMTVFEPRGRSRRGPTDPFFNDPFFSLSSGEPATLSGPALELEVRPLPSEGRPPDFSGLVGNFQIAAKLEPETIAQGGSATLTVYVNGQGNVTRIPDLAIPEVPGVKVYADQPVLETSTAPKGVVGTKTMKWALVPENAREYEIPSLSISYFDPERARYRVIETAPARLVVLRGERPDQDAAVADGTSRDRAPSNKEAVKALGEDILPAHTSLRALRQGSGMGPSSPVAWAILALPPLAFALALLGRQARKASGANQTAARSKKAAKVLELTCRQKELTADRVAQAVRTYLNDRFNLSMGSLTPNEAFEILQSRGVPSEKAERLRHVLQELDDAVFSGRGATRCHVTEKIVAMVKEIEKGIR